MSFIWSLVIFAGLVAVALLGVEGAGLESLFGIWLPYAAVGIFFGGLIARVVGWAKSPVPFRIPTTCGQQKSLPFIRHARLDNPSSALGATARMALEVLTFRSLFRNTKAHLTTDKRFVYGSEKYLWAGAMAFHWAFFVILVRHYRFFIEPVPQVIGWLGGLDGFFEVGLPAVYATDVVILAALAYLLSRRLLDARLRYFSLAADYFPLLLLLGVAGSGVLLRYVWKTDITRVKELAVGLASFSPVLPDGLGAMFYVHLFLVCSLLAYLPFSKLTHMAGVFLSPTRNLANSNRAKRHINPWNPAIVGHTYAEWEEEFRDKIKAAGIPLDRE